MPEFHILSLLRVAILLMLPASLCAQIGNERQKWLQVTGDTLMVDTLSMMPGSVRVSFSGKVLDSTDYSVDFIHARITLKQPAGYDSLWIQYRVFPVSFGKTYRHKSPDMIRTEDSDRFMPHIIDGKVIGDELFGDESLQKSGNISRGIAFGNSQNLSVNSALNLQLSGKITNRYAVMASVSDNNIPVQPDGNTQQLREFDQVFIQLYDDHNKLTAGDFILRRPTGYFMNYFKRAQGGYVQTVTPLSEKNGEWTIDASASVSKGRFSRNAIQGMEGNQGPYRLRGAEAESFIMVLAGTEAVYIDGKLLERGQDKDYTIDYNAAEIVFTPRQFITKDRRIVVEFQYSEKRYARPLLHASISRKKNDRSVVPVFYLNIYSENDAKNQPLQQELSNTEKNRLAAAGDHLTDAMVSGVAEVGFSNSQVLYAKRDSLGFDPVYVYTADSAEAKFRVSFTFVGQGKGDYTEDGFTANGRKFKWVRPEVIGSDTLSKGNYAPVILLSAPKKKQMLTVGATIVPQVGRSSQRQSSIAVEGAISNNDLNTFSSLDSGDDTGYAFKTTFYNKKKEGISAEGTTLSSQDERRNIGWNTEAGYEYNSRNFSPIERFREVEFERNWNIQSLDVIGDQHIVHASAVLNRANWGSWLASANGLLIGDSYKGYTIRSTADVKRETLRAWADASLLNTDGAIHSQFFRHKSDISQRWGKIKFGFKDEHERNLFQDEKRQHLSMASYQFYDWQISAGTADTTKAQITFFYRDRRDRKADSLLLIPVTRADQYGTTLSVRGNKGNLLRLNVSNRRLHITNSDYSTTQTPEDTWLARLEYTVSIAKNFIQGNTFYEIGSGLEQKREFIYVEVPAGQGSYIWIDYNHNGIRELNEFEVARFAYEANYIRIFTQSDQYIKTFSNQFSQTLSVNPERLWRKTDRYWQKTLSRFSDQASYRIDRKTNREETGERLNPFFLAIADSNLLALNGLLRNVLFFNKNNPVFGMDYTFQQVQLKNLLSDGFELRSDQYNQWGVRWSFSNGFTLYAETRRGKKYVASDFISGRNYQIDYLQLKPKITWQQGVVSRISLLGEYGKKENHSGHIMENAVIAKGGVEVVVNSPDKGTFQVSMNRYHISYTGSTDSSLAFDMLEGLNNGKNYVWEASFQRTVAQNLQLNFIYNGRKPEDVKAIHSGGVQVRAFF